MLYERIVVLLQYVTAVINSERLHGIELSCRNRCSRSYHTPTDLSTRRDLANDGCEGIPGRAHDGEADNLDSRAESCRNTVMSSLRPTSPPSLNNSTP